MYLGSRDQVPRKEIHQQAANHYAMLVRQEGKFLLVPVETYSFRHTDNDDRMTLEEAEQKMKSRVKRFEKRVRNMATLQQHHDEEDAAAGLTNNATAAEGGGGGNAASALALERARPMGITKTQTEKVEKADDAFADTPAVRSKAGTDTESMGHTRSMHNRTVPPSDSFSRFLLLQVRSLVLRRRSARRARTTRASSTTTISTATTIASTVRAPKRLIARVTTRRLWSRLSRRRRRTRS